MSLVALITDFGIDDWFVGEMKGAMVAVNPRLIIVDITHQIPPGDVRVAAFTLAACVRSFPEGTVFCVVVDPGVGSGRKAIVAETEKYFLIGPDNGVLSWAFSRLASPFSVRTIDNNTYYNGANICATFHGRDIFGPVAANLSQGMPFTPIGAEITDFRVIPFPDPIVTERAITTEVLAVDHFGNAITAIDARLIRHFKNNFIHFRFHGSDHSIPFGDFFQSVPHGEPLCYFGSAGYLEIGINNGNAAKILGLAVGDRIEVLFQ